MHEACTYGCMYAYMYEGISELMCKYIYVHTHILYMHIYTYTYIRTYIYVRMYLPIIVRSVRSMHWNSCKPRANMGRNMLGPY